MSELIEQMLQIPTAVPFSELDDRYPSGWEYELGAYYELDLELLGEKASLAMIIESNKLTPKEKTVIKKSLSDQKLIGTERTMKSRVIKKLRKMMDNK